MDLRVEVQMSYPAHRLVVVVRTQVVGTQMVGTQVMGGTQVVGTQAVGTQVVAVQEVIGANLLQRLLVTAT